ncbi:hypothetical protein HDU96_007218 [Phlyctochytrium bullatum]|nr:hypothetical protein HDU96_007218 [Phlyctochytrium bullatum]
MEALNGSLSIWLEQGPESPNWPQYDQRIACAKLLLELGMHDKATVVLQSCQEENDLDPEGWYLFGWCYYRMGGGDAGAADQEIAAGIGKSVPGNLATEDKDDYWSDAKECLQRMMEIMEENSDLANPDMIDHATNIVEDITAYFENKPAGSGDQDEEMEL